MPETHLPNRRVDVQCRLKGEATLGSVLFVRAWQELPELKARPLAQFYQDTMRHIDVDRWEIVIYSGEVLIGGVLLAPSVDPHVGNCLSVVFQYVIPEFRDDGVSKALMRAAKALCKDLHLDFLAFSHRISAHEYRVRYHRIQHE